MKRYAIILLTSSLLALVLVLTPGSQSASQAGSGAIAGHTGLAGKAPGNRVIRMGADPKCAAVNRGKLVIQEAVMANAAGDLADVFVYLEGNFPATPLPAEPVRIDQRNCVYRPRVVGARVGQTVEITNSDDWLHNLHSSSGVGNSFNVGQPRAGLVYRYVPKSVEVMLHLGCDVHRWMTAYVGVLDHPYFSVTGDTGAFEIGGVPPGTYTIHAWHEVYGEQTQNVTVRAGSRAGVDFSYNAE